MENAIVPNGKAVVHNLTIGFLDSSLCGVETTISARGLISNNGTIERFEISEQDVSLKEFLEKNSGWTFYAYGSVHIYDELNFLDMDVAPVNFGKYKSIFPALDEIQLPLESYLSKDYDQMRSSFEFPDWSCRNDIY